MWRYIGRKSLINNQCYKKKALYVTVDYSQPLKKSETVLCEIKIRERPKMLRLYHDEKYFDLYKKFIRTNDQCLYQDHKSAFRRAQKVFNHNHGCWSWILKGAFHASLFTGRHLHELCQNCKVFWYYSGALDWQSGQWWISCLPTGFWA